jgi:hypothetical protein
MRGSNSHDNRLNPWRAQSEAFTLLEIETTAADGAESLSIGMAVGSNSAPHWRDQILEPGSPRMFRSQVFDEKHCSTGFEYSAPLSYGRFRIFDRAEDQRGYDRIDRLARNG